MQSDLMHSCNDICRRDALSTCFLAQISAQEHYGQITELMA